MKSLYLLRGIPASGKSSWVKNNNLEKYCLSSDKIRLLFPQLGDTITQIYDTQVWNLLYELMEKRMQVGQNIIIDATHYRKSYIRSYLPYCEKYGYKIKIVDFTDVDLLTCFERNDKRIGDKVPEQVITKMYNTVKANNAEIRKDFTVLNSNEAIADFADNLEDNKTVISAAKVLDFYDKAKAITDKYRKDTLDEEIEQLRDLVLDTFPFLNIERGFDHKNKYHYRNILDHSIEVMILYTDYIFKGNRDLDLVYLTACLLHDIGKPFAMVEGSDGYRHYYNHGKVGKDYFNHYIKNQLTEIFSEKELDTIAWIIEQHDADLPIKDINFKTLQLADADAHYELHDEKNQLEERKQKLKKDIEELINVELKHDK